MTVINFIDPTARIGKNTKVWHGTYIGANTEIGDNCKIGSLVHIDYNVRIGNDCKVEGHAYLPPLSRVGNNVFLGPRATLTNDPYPMSNDMVGVTIEDDAVICAGALIKAGVTIGRGAVVAMGAIVTKNIAPYEVVRGVPARFVYYREEYEARRK